MDQTLKNQIISGDSAAFTKVYNDYCNKVYSVAFNVVKDEFDAEDIMQEVFIALPDKLQTLADESKFEPWLLHIAKNKSIDFLRKRKDTSFTEIETFSGNEDFVFEDTLENDNRDFIPEESLDYGETKRIIEEIISGLPEEQKECVMLRFAKGYSLQEISDATGVPLATVKSRLKYGKGKIETEVKELEKKGVKLYGISGLLLIPFIRWMLAGSSHSAAIASAATATTATAAATATTAATASTTAAVAGTAATGVAAAGGIKVIIAAISSVAVIATATTVGIIATNQNNQPSTSVSDSTLQRAENYIERIEKGTCYILNSAELDSSLNSYIKCEYAFPKIINLESEDVTAWNNSMGTICGNPIDFENGLSDIPDGTIVEGFSNATYSYDAWIPTGTNLLVVQIKEHYEDISSKTYAVFDLKTGNRLNSSDILSYATASEADRKNQIEKCVSDYYSEKRQDANIAHLYSAASEQRTIDELDKNTAYFIGENGKLYARVYCFIDGEDPTSDTSGLIVEINAN